MRRVPISIKLWAALAAPLLGLLTIMVIETATASREVRSIRNQADLATASIGPTGVMDGLQDERNFTVAELVGYAGAIPLGADSYEAARTQTDQAIEEFRDEILARGGTVATTYQPALDGLTELQALRADVDGNTAERTFAVNRDFANTIFDRYADLISPFLDANNRVATAIDNAELRQGAQLVDTVSRQIEVTADLVRTVFDNYAVPGPPDRTQIAEMAQLRDAFTRNLATIETSDREPYRTVVVGNVPEQLNNELVDLANDTIDGQEVDPTRILGVVDVPEDQQYAGFRDRIADVLRDEADDKAASAQRWVWVFFAGAAFAVVLAGLATWLVSRSITRPLRALTRQATDMANNRLPDAVLDILDTPLGDDVTVPGVEPVHVNTRDEVADVADALNTVQDSALDLAVEQAVLRRNIADSFVNLGRRNQNLLGRQLDFITELEHNETDPDTLANLFRLDHLATRMRRNAESLLVLAGIDPPRKWAAPVRITDAIRAALGEVEDYQRVTVRAVEPATILGSAAADLAHLLAELIENALIFSPPDQTVEIRGRAQPTGYTLAVIDSGLGMPPDELARANRRLAGAESFTIAPSKYLGHYVAGNLAARHNITVTLHNSPGHGITATVNLPPTLLTAEPSATQMDTAPGAPELDADPRLAPPDAPGAGAPGLPETAPHPVLEPVAQTNSGLTKRTPRVASPLGNGVSSRPAAATPSDELLQTLARYTDNRQDRPPPMERPRSDGPALPAFLLTPPEGNPSIGDAVDTGPPPLAHRGPPGGPDVRPGQPPLPPPTSPPPAWPGNDQPPPPLARRGPSRPTGPDAAPPLSSEPPVRPPTPPPPAPPGPSSRPTLPSRSIPPPWPETPEPASPPTPVGRDGSPPDPPRWPAPQSNGVLGDAETGPLGHPPTEPFAPTEPGPAPYPPRTPYQPRTPWPSQITPPSDQPGWPDEPTPPLPPFPPRPTERPSEPTFPGGLSFPPRPDIPRQPLVSRHDPDTNGRGGPGLVPDGSGDPAAGAPATPGGLTRRVRGAQMPNTELASLRRGDASRAPASPAAPGAPPPPRPKASSGPVAPPRRREGRDPNAPYRSPSATPFDRRLGGGPSEPPPPPGLHPVEPPPSDDEPEPATSATDSSNGDHRAADEVYSFLSSFTAGVQRGLDEARDDEPTDTPDQGDSEPTP